MHWAMLKRHSLAHRPDRSGVTCMQGTVLMALLQPAPEVYHLFDDILLLCEGMRSPEPTCDSALCK